MAAAPPKISPVSSVRRRVGWLVTLAILGMAAVLFFFNPATNRFYPVCQFHRLTGLNCPGCGMTRAAHALLHGELQVALRDNALFVVALAALAVRAGWFGLNQWRGKRNGEFFPAKFLWLLLALAVVFAVLRNLPALAFLSP
jgi:hypothetical protein